MVVLDPLALMPGPLPGSGLSIDIALSLLNDWRANVVLWS